MKKISLILIYISISALFLACLPFFGGKDPLIGTWTGSSGDLSKIEFMEDGSFKLYDDIDGTETEIMNGTWSEEGNMLTWMAEEYYNDDTGQLEPVPEGDAENPEKIVISYGVNENKLAVFSYVGEEGADTETLVGVWKSSFEATAKGSTEVDQELSITYDFMENGDLEVTYYSYTNDGDDTNDGEQSQTGTWSYDSANMELTINFSGSDMMSEVIVVDNTIYIVEADIGFGVFDKVIEDSVSK
jgi:hypothetical protein